MTAPTLTLDEIEALDLCQTPSDLPKEGGITAACAVKAGATLGDLLEVVECFDSGEIWQRGQMFAADCLVKALKEFEAAYPDDDRVRNAIIARRKCAMGEVTKDEMGAALYSAHVAWTGYETRFAAGDWARKAARSVAKGAISESPKDAALYVAYSADNDAAIGVEIDWQLNRFLEWFSNTPPEPLPLPPMPEVARWAT